MFNWDDIKLFLSVKETGSLVQTAKDLNIAHSTAYRRLKTFEKNVGARLFQRIDGRLVLSESGENILPYALDMMDRSDEIMRHIVGKDYQLSGPIRVTTTHGLSLYFMERLFRPFCQKYPNIHFKVQWDNQITKLNRFESDVIILPSKNPPENAFGRKLANISFSLYASETYLQEHGMLSNDTAQDHSFVQLAPHFSNEPFYNDFIEIANQGKQLITCNSFLTSREAINSGFGIGILPNIYGRAYDNLVPLNIHKDKFIDNELWILTHQDLQNTVRIRAFMEFAYQTIGHSSDFI